MIRPHLLSPEVRANPYPLYEELREWRPVCRVDPGGFWAISRHRDIRDVLGDPETFSSSGLRSLLVPPWVGDNPLAASLLVLDPPEHTRHRAFVRRAFSAGSMAALTPRIRAIAEDLADGLGDRDASDFMSAFAGPLPARVMAELIGLDPLLHVHFKRWTEDLAAISPTVEDPGLRLRILRTLREMKGYLTDLLGERRRRPRPDLLSELLARQSEPDALNDEELLALLFVLLPAGLETTMYLLGNAARILCERPEWLARLRADESAIPSFVNEVLRFDSPGHGTFRVCRRSVVIAEQTLTEGDVLLLLMASAGRDGAEFENPDVFDVSRRAGKPIAFGHDVHFCLGAPLARLEAAIALAVLAARFDRFELAAPVTDWNQSLTVRGPAALRLHLTQRPRRNVARNG